MILKSAVIVIDRLHSIMNRTPIRWAKREGTKERHADKENAFRSRVPSIVGWITRYILSTPLGYEAKWWSVQNREAHQGGAFEYVNNDVWIEVRIYIPLEKSKTI